MRPREVIDREAERFLAAGVQAFADGLLTLRDVLEIPEDFDAIEWAERNFFLSPETTGQTQPVKLFG